MKTKVIKITIFILLFILSIVAFFRVMNFKYNDGYVQLKQFYAQEDNTVDVLFLGSSHMFVNANPSILWDEYGIAAFNMGGSIQPYWNTYHHLVEAYKTQSPKVVVMDVYTATVNQTEYSYYENVIKNIFGMKFSRNKIDDIKASVREDDRQIYYLEYPTFHKRYTQISEQDFRDDIETNYYYWDSFNGQKLFPKANANPARPADELLYDTTVGELTPKNEEYLRKIINLAREHGSKLYLVLNPYEILPGQMPVYNRISEIAAECDVPYINFNLLADDMGFVYETDLADDCHMVIPGSEKYTRYMIEKIMEQNALEDKRGCAGYESFDNMVGLYKRYKQELDLKDTVELTEYISKLEGKDYVIILAAYDDYWMADNYGEVKEAIGRLGVDLDSVTGDGVWVLDNGNVLFESGNELNYRFIHDLSNRKALSIESSPGKHAQGYDMAIPVIRVNTTDYFAQSKGIGIAVYDSVLDKVVDYAMFETEGAHLLTEKDK